MAKLSIYESFTNNSWLGLKSKKKKVSEAGLKDKLAKKKSAKENKEEVNHEMFDYYVGWGCIQGALYMGSDNKLHFGGEEDYEISCENMQNNTHLDQDELDIKNGNKLSSSLSKLMSIFQSLRKLDTVHLTVLKVQESIDTSDMKDIFEIIGKESIESYKEFLTDILNDDEDGSVEEDFKKSKVGVFLYRCPKNNIQKLELVKEELVPVL